MNYEFRHYQDYVKSGLFNLQQLEELKKGWLENSSKVKSYANPRFNSNQMREIRLGYKGGIDASVYSKPSLSWRDMEAIRVSLLLSKRNRMKNLWK